MYFEPEALSEIKGPHIDGLLCGLVRGSTLPSALESSSMIVAEDHVRHNSSRRGLTATGGLQFKTGDEIGISLGPVVGLVTDRSARILFETNGPTHVKIHLIGRDYFSRKQHKIEPRDVISTGVDPCVVEFTNLKPNYRYTICTDLKMFDLIDAHFRTLPCPKEQARSLLDGPVKIALVSGNDVTYMTRNPLQSDTTTTGGGGGGTRTVSDGPAIPRDTAFTKRYPAQSSDMSLWRDLYERIEDDKIHMVIHVGNNIQIGGCSQTLFQEMIDANVSSQDAYEIIQEEYRKVWNESWCKHVLASCSNIMILSEADIGCLVSRPENLNDIEDAQDEIAVMEKRVREAAFKAYRKYQQALWKSSSSGTSGGGGSSRGSTVAGNTSGGGVRGSGISSSSGFNGSSSIGDDYSRMIKLNNYLTIMMVDFVGYATAPDSKIQSFNALSDLQSIMGAKEIEEKEADEEKGLSPIGVEEGLLVVSSCSFSDASSPAHHEALYPTTSTFLSALFSWKTARPAGEREVMIVSAASRYSGFAHGESTISLKGCDTKIKEWIVAPMVSRRGVALGRSGGIMSMLGLGKGGGSFTRGLLKFTHDSSRSSLAYSVLTFGGKLDSPQIDPADAHISREGRVQVVPTFWVEDFSTQALRRSVVHAFGQFQNKLYIKRSDLISTEHTCVPKKLPPFKSRIVWK